MSKTAVKGGEAFEHRFRVIGFSTIVVIYILILVGGIVRATGAGMGCPDWPQCFGQWIPPTSESELPANYQQIYANRGYSDTTFNVRKTWTEYLNRLLGVFTGLMILATLISSLAFRRRDPTVFYMALSGFILVGVQGWLGSLVVASNLHPGLITLHMMLAQLIVGVIIYAIARSMQAELRLDSIGALPAWTGYLLWLVIATGLIQLVVGTQVREAVDLIARDSNFLNRHLWIENLPRVFTAHQWLAVPLLALNCVLLFQLFTMDPGSRKSGTRSTSVKAAYMLAAVLAGTIVMGMSMQRLHLPMIAQPLHLWFASLIFGLQFFLYLIWRMSKRTGMLGKTQDYPTQYH